MLTVDKSGQNSFARLTTANSFAPSRVGNTPPKMSTMRMVTMVSLNPLMEYCNCFPRLGEGCPKTSLLGMMMEAMQI